MELLAPVGSKDALKAAVLGGADAVYLGGKLFGARRLADNFTDSELKAAVHFSHDYGVKVYVTVNILVKERELQQAFSHVDYLYSIDADALIVQDRGLLKLIRENYPISVHASTQMGIHSPEGAVWAEKNGINRIILARELHIDEIKRIREATGVELEVFAHGALCYSFSGQCLFSSILGGRSGNRGMCAQPCRKSYTLRSQKGYLLSTADISIVEVLPDLMRTGVDALKIEGRMRSPMYVYLTSKVYSSAIRRAKQGENVLITPREKKMLEIVFNRGFTRGYLFENNVMQTAYPESRGILLGNASFDGANLIVKDTGLKPGDGITLYRDGEKIGGFEIKSTKQKREHLVLRPPFKIPIDKYQIYKTKDGEFDSIERMIRNVKFPSSSEKETKKRGNLVFVPSRRDKTKGELSFYLSSLKSLKSVLPYADRVYFELNHHLDDATRACKEKGVECVVIMPRLSFGVSVVEAHNLMINSVDQFEKYSDRRLFGNYSLNFFNSLTIPEVFQYTLSPELSREDIREVAMHHSGRLEIMVFGRIELMISRDPTLNEGMLVDQKRKKFPVYRDRFGFAHILNSSDLFLLDFLDELEEIGINSFGIDLRRRNSELCEIVSKAYYERDISKKKPIHTKCGAITAGHYLRGVV